MENTNISILLPCLNEEEGLGKSIDKIKAISKLNNLNTEIIVIDNGSTDRSPQIAKSKNVTLIQEPKKGYGNAYLTGIKNSNNGIIIMADPDGSYDFNEIPSFLDNLKENDLVLGNRFNSKMERGAMPFLHKYLGNPGIRLLLRLNGLRTKEVCTGFIATRKSTLEEMKLKETGMEFSSELLVKAKNLKIKEIDITYRNREGKSKLRPLKDGLRHLKYLIGLRKEVY